METLNDLEWTCTAVRQVKEEDYERSLKTPQAACTSPDTRTRISLLTDTHITSVHIKTLINIGCAQPYTLRYLDLESHSSVADGTAARLLTDSAKMGKVMGVTMILWCPLSLTPNKQIPIFGPIPKP